jgi:hypothetical protein
MKYEENNLIENKFNPINGYLFGTTDEEFEYVLQQPNKKGITYINILIDIMKNSIESEIKTILSGMTTPFNGNSLYYGDYGVTFGTTLQIDSSGYVINTYAC